MFVNLVFAAAAIAGGLVLLHNERPRDAPAHRHPRRGDGFRRPLLDRLRLQPRADDELGQSRHRRVPRRRGRTDRRASSRSSAAPQPAAAAADRDRPQPRRGVPRGRGDLGRHVRRVPVPDLLAPAEPRPLADHERRGVPAADPHGHGDRDHRPDAPGARASARARSSHPGWCSRPSAWSS